MEVLGAVRDVAIVLLALLSIVIGILLALVLVQLRKLAQMLRQEIRPMLDTTNETVDTVQRTTTFVSQNLVDPLIKVQSYTTGARTALRNLFLIGRSVRPGKRSASRSDSVDEILL